MKKKIASHHSFGQTGTDNLIKTRFACGSHAAMRRPSSALSSNTAGKRRKNSAFTDEWVRDLINPGFVMLTKRQRQTHTDPEMAYTDAQAFRKGERERERAVIVEVDRNPTNALETTMNAQIYT
jgi:hypothetical protein